MGERRTGIGSISSEGGREPQVLNLESSDGGHSAQRGVSVSCLGSGCDGPGLRSTEELARESSPEERVGRAFRNVGIASSGRGGEKEGCSRVERGLRGKGGVEEAEAGSRL